MEKRLVKKCSAKCWCNFCGKPIEREDLLCEIYRTARRGMTRTNICPVCIKDMAKQITKGMIIKINKRRKDEEVLENL